jgi:hypothetical protein
MQATGFKPCGVGSGGVGGGGGAAEAVATQ